jgi:hypothetical protein
MSRLLLRFLLAFTLLLPRCSSPLYAQAAPAQALTIDKSTKRLQQSLIKLPSGATLTLESGSNFDFSAATITLPSNIATLSDTQTLTNKTLGAPLIETSITLGDGVTIPFTKIADAPIEVGTGGILTMGTGNLTGPNAGGTILTNADLGVTVQSYSANTTQLGNTASGSGSTLLRQNSPTITTPRFADLGFLADSNGNELIILDSVTSAVNEITVANATTGNKPTISATGGDTNISLNLVAKGTGTVQIGGVDAVTTTGTQTITNKTINAANNTVTNVSLSTGVTGTLPIANGGTGRTTGTPFWAVRTSDLARTSTTTLADDPVLQISSLAAGNYRVQGYVNWINDSGTPGGKYRIAFSGTLTPRGGVLIGSPHASAPSYMANSPEGGGDQYIFNFNAGFGGANWGITFDYVVNVSVAGDMVFQWAQLSSSADATRIKSGSFLIVTPLP